MSTSINDILGPGGLQSVAIYDETDARLERYDSTTGAYVEVGNARYIILAFPTVDGTLPISLGGATAAQTISSTVLAAGDAGTKLLYSSDALHNDFGTDAFTTAAPGEIVVPPGMTEAWFTGIVGFPPNATGTRWARLLKSPTTHQSNFAANAVNSTVISTNCPINTGWMSVSAGDSYYLSALQDSGGDLLLNIGGLTNSGASNWFKAMFR